MCVVKSITFGLTSRAFTYFERAVPPFPLPTEYLEVNYGFRNGLYQVNFTLKFQIKHQRQFGKVVFSSILRCYCRGKKYLENFSEWSATLSDLFRIMLVSQSGYSTGPAATIKALKEEKVEILIMSSRVNKWQQLELIGKTTGGKVNTELSFTNRTSH